MDKIEVEHCDFVHVHEDIVKDVREHMPDTEQLQALADFYKVFGDFTRILSSPSFGSSIPPLKKNVTCAYFSVSAILSCAKPCFDIYSPNVFFNSSFLKAMCTFGIVSS